MYFRNERAHKQSAEGDLGEIMAAIPGQPKEGQKDK